jgi:hypothetical protein
MKTTHRRLPRGRRGQRGNALILALLALAVTGLGATTALQNRRVELKRDLGAAEATVLERLRNGVQAAVHEHLTDIQQGRPLAKAGVVVEPLAIGGELVWSPSIDQLRGMGYLPDGWTASRSTLNDGAYGVTFRRVPAGCAPASCDVDGLVAIGAPILDGGPGAPVDGVTIGPILTRSGADGGVSLHTTPALIQGFNGTWTHPNPVPGNPAGVVAVRVGTNTGGLSQFVRLGDLRDPNLGGNLSAVGNLGIGGTSTVAGKATFGADTTIAGVVRVGASETAPCVSMDPGGVLSVTCAGVLNTRTGVFEDGSGNRSEVSASGIVTTGRLQSADGLQSNGNVVFGASDPNAIAVAAGEFYVRGPAGNLMSIQGGNLRVDGVVSGRRLALAEVVVEGSGCDSSGAEASGVQFSVTADRSLAVCANGRWVVSFRMGTAGGACSTAGSAATDSLDGQSLICRNNQYQRTNALMSNFVLVSTWALQLTAGPVRIDKPTCAVSGSSIAERLIILSPNNEDAAFSAPNVLSGINRYANDVGDAWEIFLERSSDATALKGNLIASIYCHYRQ